MISPVDPYPPSLGASAKDARWVYLPALVGAALVALGAMFFSPDDGAGVQTCPTAQCSERP